MAKSKSTKRALLSSVLALVLTCTMLLGTTFAWFTDSVKSGKNKIIAGNLDIELNYWDGEKYVNAEDVSLFDENALWEPGHTEVAYLQVRNAGTLATKFKLTVAPASEKPGTNVNGEEFRLSDYLRFKILASASDPGEIPSRDIAQNVASSALMPMRTYTVSRDLLNQGDAIYVPVIVYMPESVGNEANYKTGTEPPSIELAVNVVANQKDHEYDSFGNDYDKNVIVTSNIADINSAIYKAQAGDTVKVALDDDVNLIDQQIVTKAGVNVVIDGNGKTINANNPTYPGVAVIDIQPNTGNVTISNVTISGSAGSALYFRNTADTVLNNVTINLDSDDTYKGYPITFYGKGSATMNNVTVTGRTGTYYGNALFDADVFVGAEMNVTINGGDLRSIFVNANRGAAGSITADKGAHIADVRLNQDGGPRATLTQGDCTIDLIQDTI
ncbi:MAG: TasA family protein [Acutalibacteraceae bacterium]